MSISYAWAPITKSEKQEDGTITVYGPAASSALDRDNQRLDGAWLDAAMPRWLAEGGGVREQHDPKRAVGVGVGLSKGDDGAHYLTAKIVDPVAVKKIEHGVLRGFSVGIKNPRIEMGKADAPNGLVTSGEVIEVSVCDRPANSECIFALAKADAAGDLQVVEDAQVIEKSDAEAFGLPQELYDQLATPVKDALASLAAGGATVNVEAAKSDAADAAVPVVVNVAVNGSVLTEADLLGVIDKADLSAAGRKKAAASGAAMPDGSFPINTKADLRKAIKAVGRGGADHDAIRKHIAKRAKALGLEAMVPDNWNADGSRKDAAKSDGVDAATIEKAEQVLRDARALAPSLTKADDDSEPPAGGEDEGGDITGAEQAIAVIAKLIIAEAESLAQGNLNEACDIDLLLSAVRSLTWFKQREENEQSGDTDADVLLADQPDITKTHEAAAAAPTADDTTETSGADQTPDSTTDKPDDEPAASEPAENDTAVTKADMAELVKAAVAEANKASEERTKALEAELAKAQEAIEEFRALPVPGGPALTRTSTDQARARNSDAARMKQEAAVLMTKANQTTDRDLAAGYRERAQALLVKAEA